jgi:DNA primase
VLLLHIRDRAMVMRRYPNGAGSEPFFMKRAPSPRPDWLRTCAIGRDPRKIIDFPAIDDLASLLWVVSQGARLEDFRLDNVRVRIASRGDLWKPMLAWRGRTDLERFMAEVIRPPRS